MIEPVYDNILVKPEEKTGTLRIQMESQIVGTVVAVPKVSTFIYQGLECKFQIEVGDRVLCNRMTSYHVDNELVWFVKPYDIVAILPKETVDGT